MGETHPLACVCLSDTHNQHERLDFDAELSARGCTDPQRTLVLFSGDCAKWPHVREGVSSFARWMAGSTSPFLAAVPREHKIAVPGNHDDLFRPEVLQGLFAVKDLPYVLLRNDAVTVTVGGVPVRVFGLDFFRPVPSLPLMRECDIVLSHQPARHAERLSNPLISDAMVTLPPPPHFVKRLHISGHAHERYFVDDTSSQVNTWVGAALLRRGEHPHHPLRPPIVIFPEVRGSV